MESNISGMDSVSDLAPECWETADLDERVKALKLDLTVAKTGTTNVTAGNNDIACKHVTPDKKEKEVDGLGSKGGSTFRVEEGTVTGEYSGVYGNGKTASVSSSPSFSSTWESEGGGKDGGRAVLPENIEKVDSFLREALQNPRDRLTILRMEQEVERFLRNLDLQVLEFQPMVSSYYRLAAHRVAQHYYLQTQSLDSPGGEGCRIVARKVGDNRSPAVRLADVPFSLSGSNTMPDVMVSDKGPVKVAIKQRPSNKGNRSNSMNASGSQASSIKTMEERKEEYNRARARIFSSESLQSLADKDIEDDGQAVKGVSVEQSDSGGGGGSRSSQEKDEGSTNSRDSPDPSFSSGKGEVEKKQANAETGNVRERGGEGADAGRVVGDSKQSIGGKATQDLTDDGGKGRAARVAILRDREKEKRDPDFNRNYDRYSQRFDQGFGAIPMAPYGMQPLYAPLVTYNSEFPTLNGPVNRGLMNPVVVNPGVVNPRLVNPRIRPSPALNMYNDSSSPAVMSSMANPWGRTLHPIGGQFMNGDPNMLGGPWVNANMGVGLHGGVPLMFPTMANPSQQQHLPYQSLPMGGSGVSYVTGEQYQSSGVQSDIHFTQQAASRRR